jgi:hypothetical protein
VADDDRKPSFGEAVDLLLKTLKAFDEKQQRTLLTTVSALMDLKIEAPREVRLGHGDRTAGAGTPPPSLPPPGGGDRRHEHVTDVRALKEEKNPKSATQMAAVVAYYLKELAPDGERRDTVRTPDLEKYFKEAKYELPKKLEQVLVDSRRAGYFEVVTRGEYKLTRVGYNLVAHRLPEA